MLKAGEKLWHGGIVSVQLAATYNAMQDRIESFRNAGLPVPDQILNGANSLLQSYNLNAREIREKL